MRERIDFTPDYGTKATQSIIKVIGVGGGGGNAVKHMYKEGIVGVDFLICNTDRNALEASPIPSKLVLGESGLGAGANPEVARQFALTSREEIINFIGTETKMLFITAGLGKGTGTGAAPVVAEIANELGILTIAVVTLPFRFEGTTSAQFAEAGIAELKKYVDSLIIIKNQNIIKYYHDEELDRAFGYADDVLKNAVKCIAELITVNLEQNIDFNDVNSIMRKSGAAMLGIAEASGEKRIDDVIEGVLQCPLLTEEHISNARNFLFSISYGSEKKLRICELEKLTDKFEELKSKNSHVIWGRSEDPTLGDKIKLSVIISKYDTVETRVEESIIPDKNMYEGDRQFNTKVIDQGTNPFSPSSPANMISELERESEKSVVIEKKEFGFLNNSERVESRREVVDFVTESVASNAGPQRLKSTYEFKYEDDNQFSSLVDIPAIQRLHEERKEDFQEKALRDTVPQPVMLEGEFHSFFTGLAD
ncbi:MAG: cell division protein FtsZ [Lentimicrobiaceae bacterium]|nr:cell division protein FtsZ [Lentimicrobiaceae bacterium]